MFTSIKDRLESPSVLQLMAQSAYEKSVEAETDDDSIEFYRRSGFTTTSFERISRHGELRSPQKNM